MLRTMKSRISRLFGRLWWALPFLAVAGLFGLFLAQWIPGLPGDLPSRGLFGDSFGVLNTLFTGLGFAGLLITIGLQQHQIRQQANDFQAQLRDAVVRRYEDNLFRLLDLYQDALGSVISNAEGKATKGRDVLRAATDTVLKSIRQEGVNSVPHAIQKRYQDQTLSEEDRNVIDFLSYRNFWHLNYGLNRQGRLLETLKALLRHLEDDAPSGLELDTYRRIILSQITHIEVSYFFFVALGFRDEDELRELLVRTGLIKKASNIYKLQIHRFMYLEYWGHDLRRNKEERPLPIARGRIRTVTKREALIRALLKPVPAADEVVEPAQAPTAEAQLPAGPSKQGD